MKSAIAAVSLTFAATFTAIAFFLVALPPGSLPDFF
jgi:hypothetical protein